MNTKTALASRPRLLRASIARGLSEASAPRIDPHGGDFHAGIIRGMAVLTRGEALGHGLWCDTIMLQQACDAINAGDGVKARFTHPDLSGDGLGKYTGRCKNAFVAGDVVRCDLHFAQSAHETPDGDLATYLMTLAAEDPQSFGNSIAFEEDFVAEDKFRAENSKADGDGYPEFQSPDTDNIHNFLHARIKVLRAVDAVDEPAANPSGLFHRGDDIAREADALLSYTLGLSDRRPALTALDMDADRIGGFITRFLARHQITLTKGDEPMKLSKFAAGLARQLESDKDDKSQQNEKAAQEEGDADKDEGADKDKDEKRGDNYSADKGKKFASDEGQGDDEEKDKKELDAQDGDGDDDKKKEMSAAATKKLAKGGEAPRGDSAGDEGARQKDYQDVQEEEEEGSKKDAEKGTPVGSPGTEKGAVGPMGDPSHNVGYSAAVAECKRFTKAFGSQGAIWFTEGKTFAQAQELHAQKLTAENDRLKKENAELSKKLDPKRGLSGAPLSGATSQPAAPEPAKPRGAALSRFTEGLAKQLGNRGNLN
ncbi:MAG: hypothetical protein KGL39_22600 [Patescibacteria group bacterium]|nr:hypothetical protein [Patescibacteria group bacterium]